MESAKDVELDKDTVVQWILDIMGDPALESLTLEEKSVLIFDHVVEPISKELRDHYAHIAWAYCSYPNPRSAN